MSTAALSRQLEELSADLPPADETRATREAALARFSAAGFPTRKIETWHYTDLSPLAGKTLALVPPAPEPDLLARAEPLLASLGLPAVAPCLVFIDGRRVAALSREARMPEVALLGLADEPSLLLAEPGVAADAPLAALNTAFAADGVVVRVGAGLDLAYASDEAVVHLVFIGSGRELAPQVRVRIELEAGAAAIVVQHFIDLPEPEIDTGTETGVTWLNLVTDVELGADSSLELYRLQTHGTDRYQTSLTRAALARGALLVAGNVELGGKLARNELEVALNGEQARANLFGLAVIGGRQHIDNRWAVDHRAPLTQSHQEYRAIVADRSRSVFNGKVTVREHAQQIDARQRNDNLLLSPQAEVDTKPELEIYADQVACSHGATIGELSEEQMFYLRARGIDESVARGILTVAFAEKIARRFRSEWVRERAGALIRCRLPAAPQALELST
jgi:Fe-S cluster assembly protein SufD